MGRLASLSRSEALIIKTADYSNIACPPIIPVAAMILEEVPWLNRYTGLFRVSHSLKRSRYRTKCSALSLRSAPPLG